MDNHRFHKCSAMENKNGGGASIKGVLVPMSESCDTFSSNILAPLQNAYLYEESKESFRYKSAFLIKNPTLEEQYQAFRAKRRDVGYSEEELKESYGFLLFDDVNKANRLGETGVLTGSSTCSTLGDPSKGVYISKYSDCLDLNRWYHGKSGYIVIIRLTKGRVNKVSENYTQNFTAPSVGFDCHESKQLAAVSANTSSFLAFERSQYYMYELLHDGSDETAQSPSHACPFAIVSFSYADTKATPSDLQEKSEEEKTVCHYLPWKGQLQISSNLYDVGLKSTTGALIPAKLPAVVKADQAISMVDLRQLLPKAVFETYFSGEVSLDGIYCSLCELIPSNAEDSSLSLLTQELKEKDLALVVQLNDSGFLILLHSSHFLTYNDTGSSATEVLQGMFVFPDSRAIQRDTKGGWKKATISSEILQVLPALNYAESEVEKRATDQSEELSGQLVQNIQSYVALINPGLAASPSREVSIFPDQYDVPDALKYLYSAPKWTNRACQSFRSYMSQPVFFQLPVSRAVELLAAGQEERREDIDDEVYICLSSPENTPDTARMESEDQLGNQDSPAHAETVLDCPIPRVDAQVDSTIIPQNEVPDDLQAGDTTKDIKKPGPLALTKTDIITETKNLTSGDLPTELIVSITSEEGTAGVIDESLSMISAVSATKHYELQLSNLSATKLQMASVSSLNDNTDEAKTPLDSPEVSDPTKTHWRKRRRGHPKGSKKSKKSCVQTASLQTVKLQVEADNSVSEKHDMAKQLSDHSGVNKPVKTDWRKLPRRCRRGGKLSSKSKRKARSTAVKVMKKKPNTTESIILTELEAYPLRKKTDRWDLKPVISTCGRILVPHGSVDVADQIKSLKDKQKVTEDEQCPGKTMVDAPVKALETIAMEQEPRPALETTLEKTETSKAMDEGSPLQNKVVSHINLEHSELRQPDDDNGSMSCKLDPKDHSSENIAEADGTGSLPPEAVQKHTDSPSPVKGAKKSESLFNKLKTVILRAKRKTSHLMPEAVSPGSAQGTEPSLKKNKVDSDMDLKSNDSSTDVLDTNTGTEEVSQALSIDPKFAEALGLTPTQVSDKIQKTQHQDTISDTQPEPIQKPSSPILGKGRMKTLKKHQDISAEYIKKKWWLHFHTATYLASEKLKYKVCRNNSVRKNLKEKMRTSCSSTDALTLLADLALSASNGQVPQQPDPALDSSLEMCDLTKDDTSAEQESVPHALLKQPAASPILPLKSPSPEGHVGNKDVVVLISKEHAYSLPPSSSLLLGLSGTPFQVSPLSGSAGLRQHHQNMYGNGIQALHAFLCQEGKRGHKHGGPEYLKKDMVRRRKFGNSRTIVDKDGSIQVTRQWKENYDFNLDSKFTNDSKDKTIVRALHGPWDFTIQDSGEEVQLIVHMWIGLFYSRSTARLFHIDTNLKFHTSEESDCLEMSIGMVPEPTQSQIKANSSAPLTTATSDTSISKALDLSRKDVPVLNQGSAVLDLSLRNPNVEVGTSDPQVSRDELAVSHEQTEASESSQTLKLLPGLQEANASHLHQAENQAFQTYRERVNSVDIISELDDNDNVRNLHKNESTIPSQEACCLEDTDVVSWNGTFNRLCEEIADVRLKPEHVSNNEQTEMRDCSENQRTTEMDLVQQVGIDSSKTTADKEVDSNCDSADPVQTVEHDDNDSKDGDHSKLKDKPYQENHVESSPQVIHLDDGSTNKESATVCDVNLLNNDTPSAREESKTNSPHQDGDVHQDQDQDQDDHPVHDCGVIGDEVQFGMEDRIDVKDHFVSVVDSELSDKPLPRMDDGHGSTEDGNLLNNDTPSAREESKTNSPHQDGDVHQDQDQDDHPVHDCSVIGDEVQFGMEDRIDVKDHFVSVVDSELSDKPLPKMDDGHGSTEDGNLLNNDTPSAREESKTNSPGQDGEVHQDKDQDNHPVHDCSVFGDEVQFGMEDRIDVKDHFVSVVDSELSDKPLPKMDDGHGSTEEEAIAECNGKVTLAEQPPQVDGENDSCSDSLLRVQCAIGNTLTDEDTISVQVPHVPLDRPSLMEHIDNKSVDEATSEKTGNISTDEVRSEKTALSVNSNTHSLVDSDTAIPQSKHGTVRESQNEVEANFSHLSGGDNEDQDDISIEGERKVDNPTQKDKVSEVQKDQIGIPLDKVADVKKDIEDERSEMIWDQVVIPFIGVASRLDTLNPQVLNPQDKVQGQKEIPFNTENNYHEGILHTEVDNKSQEHGEKTLFADRIISDDDHSESQQPLAHRKSEFDDRCPTPTVDEKPYDYISCPDPCSSTFDSSGDQVCKNFTRKELSGHSTPTHDELPLEQEVCYKSRVGSDPDLHHDLSLGKVHSDLELRTLRVLNSIDKRLLKPSHIDKSRQFELTQDQTPSPSNKYAPTNLAPSSACIKGEKIDDMNPGVKSASAKQELHEKSLHHCFKSPFKSNFLSEEEFSLHVQLQPKKTHSSIPEHYSKRTDELLDPSLGQDSCYPYRTFASTDCLQAVHPSIDQDRHAATLQNNLGHEPRSYSQRPVMAVKPSKSEEGQAEYMSKEVQTYTAVISDAPRNKKTKIDTTLTTLLEKRQSLKEELNEIEQEGIELSPKVNWASNDQDTVGQFNFDKAKFALIDALYQCQGRETSNLDKIPSSSSSMQSIESGRRDDSNQDWLKHCLVERTGQTTDDRMEINGEDHVVTVSDSVLDYKENRMTDDKRFILGPSTSSLKCTVYNSSRKRSNSLVEQVSESCLQSDLTQTSVEKECLIFSEHMKQLLKMSRRGPSYNQANYGRSKFSCTSPVTVRFSSLEEQEDSVDHLEVLPSLIGQRIKVEMPERRGLADTTEEENTLHLQKLSYGKGNPVAHAEVSDVTAECARSYRAMMNDVCAGKTLPSKTGGSKMDRGSSKSDPSTHADFSGQMKREMYESLHINLNSVVRQSCKTKFRFYILVTSDDPFFDETKAHLEAEGHTVVPPDQFFLGEDSSSSSLLIILRNEDIAEHICEVPHLLELKKSPGVLFAGIDQPDDIVNLTHQELFNRGGFIMFERAALEGLSLGNMKTMSQFLEELSKNGKWKWMLHYRDSRQLKENARLSAEAMEKKNFMNYCQEAGIVEVLPYHECDLMSRDQPNYLNCLVCLQVQNISARFPVFITDATADSSFGRNGILTMNINSFLRIFPSDTFTVS